MYVKLGEMRERISILRPQLTYDAEGNAIENGREEIARVWAKVLPTAANSTEGVPEDKNLINYRVAIRRRADIFPDDLIMYGGKILNQIAPPYLLDGQREFMILTCREMVTDGFV